LTDYRLLRVPVNLYERQPARQEYAVDTEVVIAGAGPRREHEVGLHQGDTAVTVEARAPDDSMRTLRASYLVGCDGPRSNVRQHAGFATTGTAPTMTLYQALDTVLEPSPPPARPTGHHGAPTGIALWAPGPRRLITMDFAEPETAAVRAWLCQHGGTTKNGGIDPRALLRDYERPVYQPPRPSADDPHAIRSVGVIGGGSAGYLTALALRARRPWLDVTLVESSKVPIIGVGEATVPSIVLFLHHYLGIDAVELYRQVRPTWKLGIKFDWGPDPDGFLAPFDWGTHTVGVLGSLATQRNINAFTLQSLLMAAYSTPVFEANGGYVSVMNQLPFAYHLDNERFVGTPFHSHASSLFTDSAVTGNLPHGGFLKPYTTATTMDAGWCWNIPTRESGHLGYVLSSAFLSDDQAAEEVAHRFPGISEPRFVRFRVGRHERAWRGNVMAVGNAYGFVEPLESTGLPMVTSTAVMLADALPASWSDPVPREGVNVGLAAKWDALRWFLSIHYRFNRRLDIPFWREARERTDISGAQSLLDMYATGAPLRFRDRLTIGLLEGSAPPFYWLSGVDCVLLGQQVPTRSLSMTEPLERWRERKVAADALVACGLPQHKALASYEAEPRLQDELLYARDSWASPGAARLRLGYCRTDGERPGSATP
jgi:tryptophan halogenase